MKVDLSVSKMAESAIMALVLGLAGMLLYFWQIVPAFEEMKETVDTQDLQLDAIAVHNAVADQRIEYFKAELDEIKDNQRRILDRLEKME